MGKVKRLEFWWQLYVTSLPERDARNIRRLDFCWTECTHRELCSKMFLCTSLELGFQIILCTFTVHCSQMILCTCTELCSQMILHTCAEFCSQMILCTCTELSSQQIIYRCTEFCSQRTLCICIYCNCVFLTECPCHELFSQLNFTCTQTCALNSN